MANKEIDQASATTRRFFYGYVIVIAGFVIFTLTFGLNYTYGIFFKPLIAEFGWSRAITSAAYSIMTLIAGLLGILAGRLSDKFGPRLVCTVSGACMGVGFMLMSQVHTVWQVYLVYALIIAAGTGAAWPIVLPLVPKWFTARKGLMTGILASGVGFGIIAIPPAASWLIYNLGWRPAYIIVGGVALVLLVVAAQFLRSAPKQEGQQPLGGDKIKSDATVTEEAGLDFREAIRTRAFALMCTIYFCFGFCLHSVMVHIVPHATEFGIAATTAASIISLIGMLNIAGKLIIGSTSDRLGVKPSLIASLVLLFVAFFWLQFATELWMFYLFAALFALAYGGIMAMQALMMAELFGLRSPAALLGLLSFAYTIGGASGPYVTGYVFDITNSYNLAFLFAAFLAIAGTVLASLLKRPAKMHHR